MKLAKHDGFREKTIETVEYVSGHKSDFVKWGALALAVIVLAGGIWFYRDYQHTQRQNALNNALKVYGSEIVPAGNPPPFTDVWFRTKDEQKKAINKAFTELVDKHSGSDEGTVGHYYLGLIASDEGNAAESEKQFKVVAENGSADYSSLAKLSLAQMYKGQGKVGEGEKLLHSVMDHPTTFVTKEHATIELARLIMQSKPDEARKLLEPLRTARPAISQNALTALSELAQQAPAK
jgi:predicted negative regulator of RcsB-dependent stress response